MKIKSCILYANTSRRVSYKRCSYTLLMLRDGTPIWIRGQIVNADIATALDMAKPRPGEVVLNTILLP